MRNKRKDLGRHHLVVATIGPPIGGLMGRGTKGGERSGAPQLAH